MEVVVVEAVLYTMRLGGETMNSLNVSHLKRNLLVVATTGAQRPFILIELFRIFQAAHV